ncbi:cation transporter HKT1;3 [Magnolia sinica]|uniref:cation transporter HKT1;3 n=1 Tax=Magnolia sinica TaxID=86752 RepID=UPI00265B5B72|nr:cation transporter HKT1;3 [Magnolia sinica]
MERISCFSKQFQHVRPFQSKFACFTPSSRHHFTDLYRFLVFHLNPFWIHLCYFISISFVGFLVLNVLDPKNSSKRPKNLDMFFTSVSATTVSSMGTVELEVFSNTQLVILTLLMLIGGEVFTSILGLGLQLMKNKFKKQDKIENRVGSVTAELSSKDPTAVDELIEMGIEKRPVLKHSELGDVGSEIQEFPSEELKYRCINYLGFVVLVYLVLVHVIGSSLIFLYLILISSARDVLKKKGIQMQTFAIFTTVSSFSNCGFLPTNENMIVFKENSGLLLLVIPQILLGNTLYPPFLRLVIWVLKKFSGRVEFDHMLKNPNLIGYDHLLPSLHCVFLSLTVFGFLVVQLVMFCYMEWNSEALVGMNSYQKIVGGLFESVNSRHSGESIVDLSTLPAAILVVYVVMMYLPPYTAYLPIEDDTRSLENRQNGHKRRGLLKNLILSPPSYLAIFIILICITEREKLSQDPLNFNVLNITVEVVSAYGNVGFTTGYSCQRQLKPDSNCKDAWYGFAGRWSNKGKIILIVVMLFGRVKKFNMKGGKAWKLS